MAANIQPKYRIDMKSPQCPQEPSVLPCSFPTQGPLMVQKAAGAPALLSVSHDGRRERSQSTLKILPEALQPFSIRY